MNESKPRYFSLRWFFANTGSQEDGYGGIYEEYS